MNIVIANSNPVHTVIEKRCEEVFSAKCIHSKGDLSVAALQKLRPDYIFFLHWSHIIPPEIFKQFRCVVFHMTDVPYGRGGSPLQNLVLQGHKETMLSALKVEEGIDAGPVYLKQKLALSGTAEEIFLRAGSTMFDMINEIIKKGLEPVAQEGQVTAFRRRTPQESNIEHVSDIETLYDYIRMVDANGYPKAYLETQFFKFEFTRASLKADGILADVKIMRK